MGRYIAVGFDLDGTLFDHARAARTGIEALATYLRAPMTDAVFARWIAAENAHFELWRLGQVSYVEQRRGRLRTFLPSIDLKVPVHDAALDELFAIYLRSYRRAWRAYPDAVATLRDLRQRGIIVGVLTNGNGAQQRDKLVVTGLSPWVNVVCVSDEVGVAKPDPLAFKNLCVSLGVDSSELVFVGDHELHDVAGARAVGIRSAQIDRSDPAATLAGAIAAASF